MPTDQCQPIRKQIREKEQNVRDIEELLPEVAGPAKKRLEELLKREKARLKRLRLELQACEADK